MEKAYFCTSLANDELDAAETRHAHANSDVESRSDNEEVKEVEARTDKSMLSLHRERFNTGVKGVKADYEEYNKIQQAKREVQRLERLSLIDRITTGKTFQGESMSGSSSAMQNKDKQEDRNIGPKSNHNNIQT